MKKLMSLFAALAMLTSIFSLGAAAQEFLTDLDVTGVEATAYNGAVELSWDPVEDYDLAIAGYQVHYGLEPADDDGEYYESVEDAGDVTSYTVTGLDNGTTYYFAVIAYDEEENESANWSLPLVNATPSEEAGDYEDSEAPQVSEAEALNMEEVKVVFSEAVVLPEENAEDAFLVENTDSFEPLVVESAELDEEDESGKTVILSTEEQEEGVEYQITVGIDVEDMSGNPIISGTSDTAVFEGSGEEKPLEEPEDSEAPYVTGVEVIDNTNVLLSFNEEVVLSIDPSTNFTVVAEDDETMVLDVLNVVVGENSEGVENASVVLTTTPQEEMNYEVMVSDLVDLAGNDIDEARNSATFMGMAAEVVVDDDDDMDDDDSDDDDEPEVVAPKDVANFLAEKMMEAEENLVELSWELDEENLGNVVSQILYMSMDLGDQYEVEATLEPDATEYEVSGLEAGEYWFKLTQMDAEGNESEGVITKVILSETGPEMLGLVLVSLGLGRMFRKKRQ